MKALSHLLQMQEKGITITFKGRKTIKFAVQLGIKLKEKKEGECHDCSSQKDSCRRNG